MAPAIFEVDWIKDYLFLQESFFSLRMSTYRRGNIKLTAYNPRRVYGKV